MEKSGLVDPLIGHLVERRYLVGEKIARGGMATVYEATDLRLDRTVALKVMSDHLANDDEFSQRFVREARSAARLAHPNIVAVYDQGDDNGIVYLAMEYVAGRHTLRDLIRAEAPLNPRRAIALFEEVVRGIAAAHEAGIVHRDIKPENVLIDPRGQLKVADFGLARVVETTSAATSTGGVLLGTVSYLPPELVTDGIVDARSDVYALGVMLFEMLTGAKPYTGESAIQIAYQHVNNDVPGPSTLVEGIPPYLDAFVQRATARQRELRPADAHVLLQQLRRVRNALDNGIVDDEELADDLTPTILIARPSTQPPPATLDEAAPPVVTPEQAERDEVFDHRMYDDFDLQHTSKLPPAPSKMVADPLRGPASPPPVVPAYQEPQHGRRRGWIAFLLVLVLAAAAAFGGWYYGVGRFQDTPDVVRLSQDAAAATLKDDGLKLKIGTSAYSETVPVGNIVSTDPGPGEKVLKNGTVTAVISKGPERHEVPEVKNLAEDDATAALAAHYLTVGHIKREYNEDVAAGIVISSDPETGVELKRDDPVNLVVSRGPQPIHIDDYKGTNGDDAEAALSDAGFDVKRDNVYNDNIDDGLVIKQSPSHGRGYAGDTIKLTVSKGPHLVQVPDLTSVGIEDAKDQLDELGFKYRVLQYSPYLGFGLVAEQNPGGEDMAPFGSTVTLYVI